MFDILGLIFYLVFIIFSLAGKNKYLPIYIASFYLFLPFLIDKLITFSTTDDYNTIIGWANKYVVTLFVFGILTRYKYIKTIGFKILTVFSIFCFFTFFLGLYRSIFLTYYIKYIYSICIPIIILFNLMLFRANKRIIYKTIKYALYLELMIGIIQLFDFLHYKMYLNQYTVFKQYLTGTLINNNTYSEVLGVLSLIFLYIDSNKGKISCSNFIISAITFYLILQTGVRTGLISYVVIFLGIFFLIYKHNPRKHIYLTGGVITCFIVYFFAANYTSSTRTQVITDRSAETAYERQTNFFNIFKEKDYLTDGTTVGLSFLILSHLPENYLLGPGMYYSKRAGYDGIVNLESSNSTDCALALFICETGLLGLAIYLFLLYSIWKYLINKKIIISIIFYYYLFISITDSGLFSPIITLPLAFLTYYYSKNENKYCKYSLVETKIIK